MMACRPTNADIFSSTSHLQNLMYLERHIIQMMGDAVTDLESQIDQIKNYLTEFTSSAGRPEVVGMDNAEEMIGNPLQAFQLIKRLTVDWNKVRDGMRNIKWNDIEKLTEDYANVMPKEEDLHGAALALVRLQDTYNVNITELAAGNIKGSPAFVEMTARDCLYLGKHSFNNGYYGQAIEWFEESLHRAHLEGNTTAPVDEIAPFYEMAARIHDDLIDEYQRNISVALPRLRPAKMRFVDGDNEDYRRYQALCRGDELRTPAETKDLKCYYTNNNRHPWLLLQPVAVEEHNKSPYVCQFHQLMTPSEAELVKEQAAPMLQRAKVQTETSKEDQISGTRTSQTAWFSSDEYEIAERLSRRISALTGLSTDMNESASELMQVANYGMGGHYIPHYDYLIVDRPPEERHLVSDMEKFAGDRIATLMFYLSDVALGGGTVFPRLGVKLTATQGSAAFWWNLYRNGEGIEDTVHGACPVLMGEKWVSNHWIREHAQALRRPFTLDPEE